MSKKQKASVGGVVDNSPKVHQKKKIDIELHIKEFKWTPRQQEIIDSALKKDTRLTFIDGIYGSGKSLLGVYICLKLLQAKKISNILYVRNAVQSGSGTLGFLAGNLNEKFEPFMLPMMQKLEELLPKSEAEALVKNGIVEAMPSCLIRGANYAAYGIIVDEIGCMTKDDITLILSRAGEFTHVFGIGDSNQVDIKNSGFREVFNMFNDQEARENGVYAYELQEEMDIMRSKLVRFVMGRIRRSSKQKELEGVWSPGREK